MKIYNLFFRFLVIVLVFSSCTKEFERTEFSKLDARSNIESNSNFQGYMNLFEVELFDYINDSVSSSSFNTDLDSFENCSNATDSSGYCVIYLSYLSDSSEVDDFLLAINGYIGDLRADFASLSDSAFTSQLENAIEDYIVSNLSSSITMPNNEEPDEDLPCYRAYRSAIETNMYMATAGIAGCAGTMNPGCGLAVMAYYAWGAFSARSSYCSCMSELYDAGC